LAGRSPRSSLPSSAFLTTVLFPKHFCRRYTRNMFFVEYMLLISFDCFCSMALPICRRMQPRGTAFLMCLLSLFWLLGLKVGGFFKQILQRPSGDQTK
jgi:hypothetical protein